MHFSEMAPKSINKQQCLQAFERGDRKSLNFNEISTFTLKSHFLQKSQLFELNRTFAQKVQTWRPPVPFAYKTNDILRLLDPGIAEIHKSANFLDFCPQIAF